MEYAKISNLSKSYDRNLFDNVNLVINSGDKFSLIGQNGRGKTTFIKIFLGLEPYNDGFISKNEGLSVGYSPQIWELDPNTTPRDMLKIEDFRLSNINSKLSDPKTFEDPETMNRVMEEYNRVLSSLRSPNEKSYFGILSNMGFQETDYDIPISNLSSGQKTKLSIARALSQKADMYILDEPTNHLDLPSREWLEDYLRNIETYIIVSHDKNFVNNTSGKILELDDCKFRLYNGNYEFYLEEKGKDFERRRKKYEEQQREIERLRESARVKGIWVMRGAFKLGGTVKNLKRKADKLEKESIDRPVDTTGRINVSFSKSRKESKYVVDFNHVSKKYEHRTILKDFSEAIYRGDKIALLGPNGHGKTTLLKMIMDKESYGGKIELGQTVKISYYDQELHTLNEGKTIFEEIQSSNINLKEGEIRNILGKMLFKNKDVYKKIYNLSLGERSRVMLAKFMAEKSNFLILDEPVNNLDITSAELLQKALQNYEGTILTVSHDRSFINGMCDKIWYLEDGEITRFDGNYNLFKEYFELD